MSFYDWYCDLPPASPQTWGEQTDVPESADWYNSGFLMLWGSNVPQTRTPDAHFYTEARYRGAKSVVVSPDYSEASKFADLWLSPKQGTDAALAMALGHVILREFHLDRPVPYFVDYCRQLHRHADAGAAGEEGRPLRCRPPAARLGLRRRDRPVEQSRLEDCGDRRARPIPSVVPQGSVGFRWGEQGKWNLEPRDAAGKDVELRAERGGRR